MNSKSSSELVATFRIASMLLGTDVARVQEVVRDQLLEPVPQAPEAIAGLLNLRGQILAVTDLRTRLGLPPRQSAPANDTAAQSGAAHFIIRTGTESESLLVDQEGEVLSLADFQREEIPDTVPAGNPAVRVRGLPTRP